jgi:ArsR family metal-binding transcriptional regulator
MNNTKDREEAVVIVTELMEKINQSYLKIQNGKIGEDISSKLSNIGPLVIYNCLPRTNCEECGESTCMAFSMKLLSGDITLNQCTQLHENQENVKLLEELLGKQVMKNLGWN